MPVCKEKEQLIFDSSKDQPVAFSCVMDANPASDINFKWTFNNSERFIQIKVVII